MATAGSVVVSLLAQTGSFETDVGRATKAADKRFKEMQKSAKQAATGIDNAFKGLLSGALLGVSAGAIFGKFITETKAAQDEQAQLAAVLKSTGQAAGFSAAALNDMASQMAGVFSDGDINQAQTALLAFTGIVGDEFPRALQSAIDMAARTGMTVTAAAETIGRALDVPSKGLTSLSKQGFRFTEDQKKLAERLESTGRTAEAQGIILKALEESYGGAADAARNTLGGALTAMQNQIDSLMTGDDGSVNGLTQAINELTDALGSEETKETFSAFVGWLADTAKALVTLSNEFAAGMRMADGFFDSLLTYGTINPFNSPQENVEKYTAQLKDAVAWRDRLLAEGDPEAAKTVEGKIRQIENQLNFSRRQVGKNEEDVFSAYLGVDETGSSPFSGTLDPIRVPTSGSGSKTKKKNVDHLGVFIKEKDIEYALEAYQKYLDFIGESTGKTKEKIATQQNEWLAIALENGDATYADILKGMDQTALKAEEFSSEIGEFALEAARNIQSSLGDGLYDILTGNFDNIGSKFGDMLTRMASDAAAANLAKALFGDYDKSGQIGGILGNIAGSLFGNSSGNLTESSLSGATWGTQYTFGGGRASGGPVSGGKFYEVNENGPELFTQGGRTFLMPGSDGGHVTPTTAGLGNPPSGGGQGMQINIINQSSQPVQAKSSGPMFNGKEYVTTIVLTDLKTNGPISQQMGRR